MSAELAAERAALDRLGGVQSSNLMAAIKAMNRAGGYLEAVSVIFPELSVELLEEFEVFATRLDSLTLAAQANGERRRTGARDDRRGWNRRLTHERRHQSMTIAVERRLTSRRRTEPDRRGTGRLPELADRRWRAVLR
ncbi:MAG TPA: hypothetical protein VIP78_10060 [Candidatus Dormibacteraeota bacterium]